MSNLPCPHCGQTHPSQARFCPVTGKTLTPRVSTIPLVIILGILVILVIVFAWLFNSKNQATANWIAANVPAPIAQFFATLTPTPTPSSTPTFTPSHTATFTITNTLTSTPTYTPTPQPTRTSTATDTPRPLPTNTYPAVLPTSTVPSDRGMIIIQGQSYLAGLSSRVQWIDGLGRWNDVDNWHGYLDANGRISWIVLSNEFNKGPFRWIVYNFDNSTRYTSPSFYLPGAGQKLLFDIN